MDIDITEKEYNQLMLDYARFPTEDELEDFLRQKREEDREWRRQCTFGDTSGRNKEID